MYMYISAHIISVILAAIMHIVYFSVFFVRCFRAHVFVSKPIR